ncbi:MAG: GNAT family N-acetyltransferase [Defluviitaleaceae bacterium]|nr:GNAT family N-acetyltransferase [Defluviitaleaceae bacterium]
MTITERDITKQELQDIYDDFKELEILEGIPDIPQVRYQFTAEENSIIIGYVSGLTNHKIFYLTDLWVHKVHRRQKLGTKLLKMMEEKILELNIEHIYTWTTGCENQNFYKKQGYVEFTIFEDYCGVKGYHKVGYRKFLSKEY